MFLRRQCFLAWISIQFWFSELEVTMVWRTTSQNGEYCVLYYQSRWSEWLIRGKRKGVILVMFYGSILARLLFFLKTYDNFKKRRESRQCLGRRRRGRKRGGRGGCWWYKNIVAPLFAMLVVFTNNFEYESE